MKRTTWIFWLFLTLGANAQNRKTDAAIVSFTISHALGSTAHGTFEGFEGSCSLDPLNLAKASLKGSVDVKTIDTGLGLRDKTLKGSNYFETDKYPKISMVSTKIEKGAKENEYTGYFNLTIKRTTKNIKVPFTVVKNGSSTNFMSIFQVNRLVYEVGEKSSLLGDIATVTVNLNIKQ